MPSKQQSGVVGAASDIEQSGSRIVAVDMLRFFAICAVVCLHTRPFRLHDDANLFGDLVLDLSGFAVTFFFVAAGYFWAGSSGTKRSLKRDASRLAHLGVAFAFWSLVYVVLPRPDLWLANGYLDAIRLQQDGLLGSPIRFLLRGTINHLWFLPSLAMALIGTSVGWAIMRTKTVFFAIALWIVALLGGAYEHTPVGIDFPIHTRLGPFFATLPVCIGFLLRKHGIQMSSRSALLLILLGVVVQQLETHFLRKSLAPLEFFLADHGGVAGTLAYGTGVFLLAISPLRYGGISWMAQLGKVSLGLYAAHYWFALALNQVNSPNSFLWEMLRPILTIAITTVVVLAIAKSSVTRRLVM